MSSSTYTIESYLLDRALIHDTVTSLTLFLDLGRFEELTSKVLAEKVEIDYKSVLGTEPYVVEGEKQVLMWRGMLEEVRGQHVTTSLLIDLPLPSDGVQRPEVAGVIGNVLVTLVESDGEKKKNGGRYVIEVTRTTPSSTGNPWRISKLKADLVWDEGGFGVLGKVEPEPEQVEA